MVQRYITQYKIYTITLNYLLDVFKIFNVTRKANTAVIYYIFLSMAIKNIFESHTLLINIKSL